MKEAEIEKSKYFYGQNYAIGLSKNPKIKALSRPNEIDFQVQNLILNRLAQISSSKGEKQKSSCGIFFLPCFHFGRF